MNFVFLPGLDGTSHLFKFISPYFADHHVQNISYPKNVKFTYPEYIDFLEREITLKNYHLIAESFSGPIALEYCCQKLGSIKSLILVATFGRAPRPALLLKLTALFSFLKPPVWMIENLLLNGAESEVKQETLKIIKSISSDDISRRLENIATYRLEKNLPKIPTLYIKATKDLIVKDSEITYLNKYIESITVSEIEGPHLILQSNPKSSSSKIIEFAHLHS